MDEAALTTRLLELSRQRFAGAPAELSPDDDLFQSLGIDSVQALELLSELERTFGVELPDYELAEVRSFAELARKLHERL
ncbi:MAG: acyl carrier protein [Planctomycetota bacterium]|nr:MAG: acyl carrier protein [Planctomycetota bacterium]